MFEVGFLWQTHQALSFFLTLDPVVKTAQQQCVLACPLDFVIGLRV